MSPQNDAIKKLNPKQCQHDIFDLIGLDKPSTNDVTIKNKYSPRPLARQLCGDECGRSLLHFQRSALTRQEWAWLLLGHFVFLLVARTAIIIVGIFKAFPGTKKSK